MAISIPIFTSQLEKSKEATDWANLRSAYAEVMTASLTEEAPAGGSMTGDIGSRVYTSKEVEIKQTQPNWQTTSTDAIGEVAVSTITPNIGGSMVVKFTENASGGTVTIENA